MTRVPGVPRRFCIALATKYGCLSVIGCLVYSSPLCKGSQPLDGPAQRHAVCARLGAMNSRGLLTQGVILMQVAWVLGAKERALAAHAASVSSSGCGSGMAGQGCAWVHVVGSIQCRVGKVDHAVWPAASAPSAEATQ